MPDVPATQANVSAAVADYNTLRPQKSGTDTMAAISAKYGSTVANAVRAQVGSGVAPAPTPPASSGPAAGAYGFSSLAPSVTSSAQGDMPRYAPAGANNTRYSTLDQAAQAANPNSSIPLVGWNAVATPAQTGGQGLFGRLSNTLGTATSSLLNAGTTYYTASSAWQAYVDMPTDQRIAIQKQLLATGKYSDPKYYPSGSRPPSEAPKYGAIYDQDTFNAFQAAFAIAKESGIPLDQVLNSADANAQNAAQIWQQNTQVGKFTQTSPEELNATADAQAVSILGRKATADEKALIVSLVQGKEIASQRAAFEQTVGANRSDLAVQMAGGIGQSLGAAGSSIAGGASPASVNALVSALGGQESGSPAAGGYGAINKDSGAMGRFQILPENWKGPNGWAAAAGLGPDAPKTPQNQEIVARNQISIYLKNGNGDPAYVAVAWYAGEETAKAFQADPTNAKWQKPQITNGQKYPSIASYAQSIAAKVGASTPGTLATQSMVGQVGNLPAGGPVGGPGTTGTVGGPATSSLAQAAAGGISDAASVGTQGGSPDMGGAIAGALGGAPVTGQSSAGGTVPFGPGLNAQGQSTLPAPTPTAGGGQPTVSQLMPTSEGIYTSVNPAAEAQALLRRNNPQIAGAHDIAQVLDAVHALFKAGS